MEVRLYLRLCELGWESRIEVVLNEQEAATGFCPEPSGWELMKYSGAMMPETVIANARKYFARIMDASDILRVFIEKGSPQCQIVKGY